MTTLCLCDWVETQADRQIRLAAAGLVTSPPGQLPADPVAVPPLDPLLLLRAIPQRVPLENIL